MNDRRLTASQNPFATSRIDRLDYRFIDVDWEQFLLNLDALGRRAAIVGNHGCGKTTLLDALALQLAARGHCVHRLTFSESKWDDVTTIQRQTLDQNHFVLADGAERFGPLRWRRFMAHLGPVCGLVITLHAPARLPTLYTCETSTSLLDSLLEDLAASSDDVVRQAAHTQFARHNGNIREVFRALYDHCAGLGHP